MAIYHFSAQIISRSQGRSSVAASAYRSAEKLIDERTGLTHDYTKKNDVIEKAILRSAGSPNWMGDRQKLWNGVEQIEKRKDAQLAREINIALPKELTDEQNWSLLKCFVEKEFVAKGMVADVAFHRGHSKDEEQPHGHVMLTLREVTAEGFGKKVRAWNDKALLNTWREHWAEHCNQELARHDIDQRIDHRRLDAQGINLEPQSKIGPKEAAERLARLAEHQALARRNGERLLADPSIAWAALTQQYSTFTHQDIARFVNRHTGDQVQFEAVYHTLLADPKLVSLGRDQQGRDRLTTQTLLTLETRMITESVKMSQKGEHGVSPSLVEAAIASRSLSDEQKSALTHLMQPTDLACVVGFAGTGKSYLLGAAREAWEKSGYRVQGMTLSGIAAENLDQASGIVSHTVANRLWRWDRGRERLCAQDVVVVDEAGMLGSRQLSRIVGEANRVGAKVVLVGDPEQLQAIEAGAAYRAIAERVGFVELTGIRRQAVAWQQQATRDLACERTKAALTAYACHDHLHRFEHKEAAMSQMIEQWYEVRRSSLGQSQILLAYTRDEVRELNERARALRQSHYELGKNHEVETTRGVRTFAKNDVIYFLRNEPRELQVKNGTLGIIDSIRGNQMVVTLHAEQSEARQVTVDLKTYADIDHGYAATVYKAQGVTVDRAHVLASPYFDRHSTYVAMSRHRESVDLYVNQEDFPNFGRLSRVLGRERTKDVTVDYAQTRGLEVGETRRLSDRWLETPSQSYSTVLTEDRAEKAAQRLAQRQQQAMMRRDIGVLEQKLGYSVSLDIQAGDTGLYRGLVKVAGQEYGLLEQQSEEHPIGKLIPREQLASRRVDRTMTIEQHTHQGQDQLMAVQARQRELSKGFEMEYGGL